MSPPPPRRPRWAWPRWRPVQSVCRSLPRRRPPRSRPQPLTGPCAGTRGHERSLVPAGSRGPQPTDAPERASRTEKNTPHHPGLDDMSSSPQFGAGLWHFASYVDRYATDGYAPPVDTLEQIARAGDVGDLSFVDVPYPFTEGVTVDAVKAALAENGLQAIGVTPEIYMRRFSRGAFTNPDPAGRAEALEVLNEAADVVRALGAKYLKVWPGQDGWDYPFQVSHREQ